ncbi:rhamnulokinase [Pantoea ananatis]|uniref:rhamnulokinase n=1 Tax=Pantoea ananas TaxID=553 RepID=UPI0015751768|nr:rhamnulokinase [Pantoea ananatis]NQE80015.1 rhamnulokinase [Pantoea ananatis]NQE84727.1 rhamnulokinase [Pantoea ananatis]
MNMRNIVAIDLGASSGRVMLAQWTSDNQQIALREVCRFANQRVQRSGYDCWDLDRLEQDIRAGLQQLDDEGIVPDSMGIDTWGVDLVLLDADGHRVGEAVSYRDKRTEGLMARAIDDLGQQAIYQRTGIQFLPFNTLYQLRALHLQQPDWQARVKYALMIPDYLHYRLTGKMNWEYTNATTTQLLNIQSGEWDRDLLDWAGVDSAWFGTPHAPGNNVGYWASASGKRIPVIAVATHDTASAVLATPLMHDDAAYLSSGTWSLMGIESLQPYVNATALQANITNEGGAEGYRVLKNIMGLWLLQRVCSELNIRDLPLLIADAAKQPACRSLIDPNHPRFINPDNMVQAIQHACAEQAMPIPHTAAALARTLFDSLALLYRQTMLELGQLRGTPLRQLHIVGGGSQNPLLNQLCADACQLPVIAGPVEASTLGNVGCQLIALGELRDVADLRRCISRNFPSDIFEPLDNSAFAAHQARFTALLQPAKELAYDKAD